MTCLSFIGDEPSFKDPAVAEKKDLANAMMMELAAVYVYRRWGYFPSSSITTELVLELQAKLVNEVERLHQEDVVFEGRGRHGPQRCHVGSGHPHSVDLDAFLSGLGRHLRHAVLRTSVRHDHDHVGNLRERTSGSEDDYTERDVPQSENQSVHKAVSHVGVKFYKKKLI